VRGVGEVEGAIEQDQDEEEPARLPVFDHNAAGVEGFQWCRIEVDVVYLVVAATLLLLLVVTAIAGSDSGPTWVRPVLLVWLSLALILTLVWTVLRPGPLALRRIDALWDHDRLAALLLVKLLIATSLIVVLVALLIVLK
jgi:hypothetical protein